jgi:hypothetical protein
LDQDQEFKQLSSITKECKTLWYKNRAQKLAVINPQGVIDFVQSPLWLAHATAALSSVPLNPPHKLKQNYTSASI